MRGALWDGELARKLLADAAEFRLDTARRLPDRAGDLFDGQFLPHAQPKQLLIVVRERCHCVKESFVLEVAHHLDVGRWCTA